MSKKLKVAILDDSCFFYLLVEIPRNCIVNQLVIVMLKNVK